MLVESEHFAYDYRYGFYYKRHCLSNGQVCQIVFYQTSYAKYNEYYVGFVVADKKKQLNSWLKGSDYANLTLKSTGRCGAEALCWARRQLLEFEDYIRNNDRNKIKIVVSGEDSRRFRVYEKALSKYGYRKVISADDNKWNLIKILD